MVTKAVTKKEKLSSNYEVELTRVKEEFKATWPRLLTELLDDPTFDDVRDSMLWLEHVLQENVPFGKQQRAMMGISVYFELTKDREHDDQDKFLCYVSGWCAEIMQTAALIADDIMDGSYERRGKPCWYKRDDIGFTAFNDSILLENLVYHIMWKYFSKEEYFLTLLKVIMDTGFKTILGQCFDTRLIHSPDLTKFTMDNYKAVAKYKTSYYSFYCPVVVALIRAGEDNPELLKELEQLTLEMGHLFQAQDDFLDCFGDPEITGKIGTDITDRKLTWLIATALECANDEQKTKLKENYGKVGNEATVKEIFEDLEIEEKFREEEDLVYNKICHMIKNLPEKFPRDPLNLLLNSMYRRKK